MGTPVLTKIQKKLSLSGKKQKKEVIKNVVANPHESYWPLICNELESLVKVLKQNLPRLRPKKINVPWNVLKNISKENRKIARNEYLKINGSSEKIVNEENLVFGVNEVTKCLECNSCSIVLVAEVNPRILVQHIFELTILHNVPVLVVPDLKQTLKECCGLDSLAITIKKSAQLKSNLVAIVNLVIEISKNYPKPQRHINSNRSEQLLDIQKRTEEDPKTKSSEFAGKTGEIIQIKKCHLYRSTINERIFIPEGSQTKPLEKPNDEEFLSFNNSEILDLTNVSRKRKSQEYTPLKVKRLKGNKNRQRDKIEHLKKRKKKGKI